MVVRDTLTVLLEVVYVAGRAGSDGQDGETWVYVVYVTVSQTRYVYDHVILRSARSIPLCLLEHISFNDRHVQPAPPPTIHQSLLRWPSWNSPR